MATGASFAAKEAREPLAETKKAGESPAFLDLINAALTSGAYRWP